MKSLFDNSSGDMRSILISVTSLALAISVACTIPAAYAGRIVSGTSEPYAPNAEGFVAHGFGGWNLDNVDIKLSGTNSGFDEADGSYYFDIDSDYTYQGNVFSGDLSEILGYVFAKDWPVGEPSGIKVINDDFAVKAPSPTNCIMATSYLEEHYLDSADPSQVTCSGPFQSHKRYKLAMLPATVSGGSGAEKGIDLVFNVESEAGSRDYQVFQKINNWTDHRLEGFKIQVGTGVGTEFTPAGAASGVGVNNLSLSVPAANWTADQLAVFSTGLFGPLDLKHGRPPGFFDPDTRAGFLIQEYPNLSGQTDTLHSGATLGSDYVNVPPGGEGDNQFGTWLPNNMLPQGIFWDDDGNPETDAVLVAWYGRNPAAESYSWMGGANTNFATIPDATIQSWGANLEYTQGVIDDLVNVGLNYIVTVGDVSGFPKNADGTGRFTIRVTPAVDTSGTGAPGYTDATNTPDPQLIFTSSDGVLTVSPSPQFVRGELLTARVGDADMNRDENVAEEVYVTISSSTGLSGTLTLVEQGLNRGVFVASLPDVFSDIGSGESVTVSYEDGDIGDGTSEVKKVVTQAVDDLLPPPSGFVVSIADLSVPSRIFVGQLGKVSVTVENAAESETAVSGELVVYADSIEMLRETFTDLAPNRKYKASIAWTANYEDDSGIDWIASVIIDGDTVATATASTIVSIKPGK